jgi:hypothetical protein
LAASRSRPKFPALRATQSAPALRAAEKDKSGSGERAQPGGARQRTTDTVVPTLTRL